MGEALLSTRRRRLVRRAALCALGALAGSWVALAIAPPNEGKIISRVEIRSDGAVQGGDSFWRLVDVEAGKPLSSDAVQQTLRNLVAAGAAADAEVFEVPEGDRVAVVVALWGRIRIASVKLAGELGLKERELRTKIDVHAGEPLIETRILRSVFNLKDEYERQGYLEAQVRVGVEESDAEKRADITFHIESGVRTTVGSVAFTGSYAPLTEDELRDTLRMKAGDRYRPASTRAEVDRLQHRLLDLGFREAEVNFGGAELDPGTHSVQLNYAITLGPKVEIEIVGADRKALQKRELLPFLGSQGYDEALLLQAVDLIRADFQSRGFYRVDVEHEAVMRDGVLHVRITIRPGTEFTLDTIQFEGNTSFSAGRLRQLMATSTRRLAVPGSGRLVDSTLDEDLANLRTFYALQGFPDARVGPAAVESQGDRLSLSIPIKEGKQQRVVELQIDGVQNLDIGALRKSLSVRAGGPYHPQLLEDSLDLIRSRYEDAGYPWAQASASTDWNADRTLVNVKILVLEGPQVVVNQVIVRGEDRTGAEVIRRSTGIHPGDPISVRKRLEVQRRLYNLGVFSSVQVEMAPGTPYDTRRNLIIRVKEGLNRKVTYGFGYDSEDGPRGLLGLSWSNVGGRAVSAVADAKVSDINKEYRFLVRQPYVGRLAWPVTFSLFQIQERHQDFTSKRRGLQTQIERTRNRYRVGLLYTYRVVDVLPPKDLQPGSVFDPTIDDPALRNVQIASVTPSLFFDRRDDPIDPTRGWSANLQLEYAFPVFAANENFLKLFLQGTEYFDLGRSGVIAASARFGAIEPLAGLGRDPIVPPELPSSGVPISERFFAGGRSSHRAYRRDNLGIVGQTLLANTGGSTSTLNPVGGDGLALVNVDYRFPLAGALEGLVFTDAGNVWADWRHMHPRDVKFGSGVGLRYRSPIGPLRMEIGWKLQREGRQSPYQVYFSFGNPF